MRFLITGCCGFIGSHLAEYLLKLGHEVHGIDNLSSGKMENLDIAKLRLFVAAECQNWPAVVRAAVGCDYVFHAASTVGVQKVLRNPSHCIENILDSTRAVLKLGIPGMYFSTSEVYGKRGEYPLQEGTDIWLSSAPRWSYAAAKLTGEWLALAEKWNVVRLFNVVGPRQCSDYGAVLPRFVKQALADEPITVYGDGSQVRTFTSVHDVVRILHTLSQKKFEIVNVGSTNTYSILDLAEKVLDLDEAPAHLVKFVPYDKAYPAGFEECPSRIPDLSRLHRLIGVQTYLSLESIIKEMRKQYVSMGRRQHDTRTHLSAAR